MFLRDAGRVLWDCLIGSSVFPPLLKLLDYPAAPGRVLALVARAALERGVIAKGGQINLYLPAGLLLPGGDALLIEGLLSGVALCLLAEKLDSLLRFGQPDGVGFQEQFVARGRFFRRLSRPRPQRGAASLGDGIDLLIGAVLLLNDLMGNRAPIPPDGSVQDKSGYSARARRSQSAP